jgi:branched-chain amino acid transport system permease protein
MGRPIVAARQELDRALAPGLAQARSALDRPVVRAVLLTLLVAVLILWPIVDTDPVSQGIDTASAAEVYVLLALGLNIVVGFAGLLDLGYAAFYAIGAYCMALLASSHITITGHSFNSLLLSYGPGGLHINFFLMIPIAALVAATCGALFGAPTLRLRGDYLAIVTLGFGEIVPKVIQNLGPDNSLGLPNITNGVNRITGIDTPPDINVFGLHWTFQTTNPRPWYYLGLIIIAFSVVVIYSLRKSRLGRAWAAIREDEIAAAHMGINITRTRLLAFSLGAAFSGFGGLIEASKITSVDYTQFGFDISITILVMVILGGIGSIPGAIIGAVLLSYLDLQWLADINGQLHAWGQSLHTAPGIIGTFGTWLYGLNLDTARPLIFGIILLAIMLLRPQGLWPSSTRAREMQPETAGMLAEEDAELYTVRQE